MAESDCCPSKTTLANRALLDDQSTDEILSLFKVLSNSTRLKILHCLIRQPSLSVSDIATTLTMKVPAISNQLQKLVEKKIIKATRTGNFIKYRIIDDCTTILLERAWCLAEDTGKIKKSEWLAND